MGIITEIKFQKRNKNRVSIYVDGEFLTGMESIVCASRGLKPGVEVNESELIDLALESQLSEAFDKSLGYISKVMRTEREIREYLIRKEYSAPVINACVEKLFEYGYLDDEKYLKAYLSCYSDRGILRIKADLLKKGVDKQLVDEYLSELDGQDDSALIAAQKYLKTHKNSDKTKLMRHLYSKGFDYSAINHAVQNVKTEDDADGDFE